MPRGGRTHRFNAVYQNSNLPDVIPLTDEVRARAKVRTLADMSEEEIRALEERYGCPVRRPGARERNKAASTAKRVSALRERAAIRGEIGLATHPRRSPGGRRKVPARRIG